MHGAPEERPRDGQGARQKAVLTRWSWSEVQQICPVSTIFSANYKGPWWILVFTIQW